jgi:predicted transcriptional regulator
MKDEKIITTTYLPKKTVKKLKVYAARRNTSMSQVMESAVKKYMEAKKE